MVRIAQIQHAIENVTSAIMEFSEQLRQENYHPTSSPDESDDKIKLLKNRIQTLRQIRESLEDLE